MYSAQQITNKGHNIYASGFPNDIRTVYQSGTGTVINPSSSYSQRSYLSQMGRINYSFDSRYLLTLTARRDGYSAFGDNNKFGVFPSAALGWNLHNERFMENVDWLSQMKLRASYGLNGNQAISPYSTLPSLYGQHYMDQNHQAAIGYRPAGLGDPTLGWESAKVFNFGLDFGFLDNRLRGTFEIFDRTTYDLLLSKSISPINGTTSITQNIGEVDGRGFELQISSINFDTPNFEWRTDLNLTRSKNEIVHVGLTGEDGEYIDDVASRWFIGKEINVNYGYKLAGIWQEGDDIENSHMPDAEPGDIRVADTDGDGELTEEDRTIIGTPDPDFTFGLNKEFSLNNISLRFFIYGVEGSTKLNPLIPSQTDFVDWNMRRRSLDIDYWEPDDPSNRFPANRDNVNPYGVNYYEDASYIRLQELTLSYNFPNTVISGWGLNSLRLYVNAKNLATWTEWKGLDPEFSSQLSQPLTRIFLFGINVGL